MNRPEFLFRVKWLSEEFLKFFQTRSPRKLPSLSKNEAQKLPHRFRKTREDFHFFQPAETTEQKTRKQLRTTLKKNDSSTRASRRHWNLEKPFTLP